MNYHVGKEGCMNGYCIGGGEVFCLKEVTT